MENNKVIGFDSWNIAIKALGEIFGAKVESARKLAVYRSWTSNKGYLAFTNPDQPDSQSYSGLSFVVFPIAANPSSDKFICVLSIGVGTEGLGEDINLAVEPYMRRVYSMLSGNLSLKKDDFFPSDIINKNSFADVDTPVNSLIEKIEDIQHNLSDYEYDIENIRRLSEKYIKVLSCSIIIEFTNEDLCQLTEILEEYFTNESAFAQISISNKNRIITRLKRNLDSLSLNVQILIGWLAQYALIRKWCGAQNQIEICEKAVSQIKRQYISSIDEQREIEELLYRNRCVLLQGAPGTGKTRMANQIFTSPLGSIKFNKCFFTQFHAETTYAEFIGGIQPVLDNEKSSQDSSKLSYKYKEGIFTEALVYAENHPDEKILLIIDEINRANLANVLGPVFYLFEKNSGIRNTKIKLSVSKGNPLELAALPDNVYVLAMMNTADKSLGIVDYALRRRFIWYTMSPRKVEPDPGYRFHNDYFDKIEDMFLHYASDEELNLQPGQSYFITPCDSVEDADKLMQERLIYEIMPLMKEYFNQGFLTGMIDEFSNFYREKTGGLNMYR